MNFNHLKVFLAVAKNLNYSRAAEELFISQSTVSIQINKLEDELGIELFEQLGKKVYLTQAGELLYFYTKRIFSLEEEAELTLQEFKGIFTGRLVIGASNTPGIYLLPPIIGSFQKKYSNLSISLKISNTHDVQEKILANQLDFGVVGEELVMAPQLNINHLFKDELVVIAAKVHPFAAYKSIPLKELLKEKLILRERGSSTREVLEEKLRIRDEHVNPVMELNSIEAIKQTVAANLGLSIVSKLAIQTETAAGVLHILTIDDLPLKRQINLIYHKDKSLAPSAVEFIKTLKNENSIL